MAGGDGGSGGIRGVVRPDSNNTYVTAVPGRDGGGIMVVDVMGGFRQLHVCASVMAEGLG